MLGREHASAMSRNNDAPKLNMQSSPVNDKRLAIFGPKKIDETGNQRVGTIPVARRIDGPISHIGHLMYPTFVTRLVSVTTELVVLVSLESRVSNKAVGPVKNSPLVVSSFVAYVTGGGSHEDTFVQQTVRCFVAKCGKVNL